MEINLSMLSIILLLAIISSWLLLAWFYRQTLWRFWTEPVLRHPVLIIESDDWGPGPELHARRLSALADMLQSHRDTRGRHPVMTLGVVLAVPDTVAIREEGLQRYARITLDDSRCQAILGVMRRGHDAGVFALQLHGMEHFWPPALMASAEQDPKLRHWLTTDPFPSTEDLPSHLQSRWVDGSTLPSSTIAQKQVEAAVREEVMQFRRIFGAGPQVAVPPTFIWTEAVENAWIDQGIEVIVTPGRQYTYRDSNGKPAGDDRPIRNGEPINGRGVYLVRDKYFEPSLGHTARQGLAAVRRQFCLGRPALLETHRFNFTGDEDNFRHSLRALDTLLTEALQALPGLRFMTTEELSRVYRDPAADLFARSPATRIHVWLRRLGSVRRLRKLAWLCGLVVPAALLSLITVSSAPWGIKTRSTGQVI